MNPGKSQDKSRSWTDTGRQVALQLRPRIPDIVRSATQTIRTHESSFAMVPFADMLNYVHTAMDLALSAIGESRGLTPEDLRSFSGWGREAVRIQMPLANLISGFWIGAKVLNASILEEADRMHIDPEARLEILKFVWDGFVFVFSMIVEGYRHAELENRPYDQEYIARFVYLLLSDALPSKDISSFMAEFNLDLNEQYYPFIARPIANQLSLDDLRKRIMSMDHDGTGIQSDTIPTAADSPGMPSLICTAGSSMSGLLLRYPPEGANRLFADISVVAIGPPSVMESVHNGYRIANRILTTCMASNMSGIHSLDDTGIQVAVLSENELSEYFKSRYVDPVSNPGSYATDILETVRSFIHNAGRMDPTARVLRICTVIIPNRLTP